MRFEQILKDSNLSQGTTLKDKATLQQIRSERLLGMISPTVLINDTNRNRLDTFDKKVLVTFFHQVALH